MNRKENNIHLMYGSEGNSFVFSRVVMFPETKSRETAGPKGMGMTEGMGMKNLAYTGYRCYVNLT